jgi:hypothetical protein
MGSDFWAITAYFNPMHCRRRQLNYRVFRQHLTIPLVAVELGYDGQFDLGPGDADILVQIPGTDVMWQKERLFNIALSRVPPAIDRVACLDSDICLNRPDVWREAGRVLQRFPIAQLFSHVFYLPADHPLDFALMQETLPPCPGFGWLQEQGRSALELCNPIWTNPGDLPPVTYGLGWAFRREVFAEHGFYDSWIVGGGTRVHFFAAHGLYADAGDAFRFHAAMREHYCRWSEDFHAAVRGRWSFVPGHIAHLWHGDMARRKHRQRYKELEQFKFDPSADLAFDEHGAWRWNSNKPAMHQYLREYIADRQAEAETARPIAIGNSRIAP